MVEVHLVKNQIIDILQKKGPSLPMQIAKELNMNSLFVSAFLSELMSEKRIKMSSLKVGGSHLYLIEGQEQQLEKFYSHLHPKESEAYLMLKEKKILKDSEQEPAIRVALRSIKDFAFSFKNDEEIFWRYLTTTELEIRDLFNKKPANKQFLDSTESELGIQEKTAIEDNPKQEMQKKIRRKTKTESLNSFKNPLIIQQEEKQKPEKPKSEFALSIIKFLEKNDLRIIDEKEFKAKEYRCISETDTKLGPIAFLTEAKDKKIITDLDLQKLLSEAQSIPLPALIFYTGELSKKAKEYQEKYYSILKTKRIE